MDGKHLTYCCIATLLLSLTIIHHGEGCSYEYKRQPAATIQDCSLEGYTENLELICQVSGPTEDMFTIQWHYSMFLPMEFDDSSIVNVDDLEYIKTDEQVLSEMPSTTKSTSIASVLTITVSDHGNEYYMIDGYYWCSVNSTSDIIVTDNPSQVVNISSECFMGHDPSSPSKCSTTIYLHGTPNTSRCADGQPVDVAIVDAWNSDVCTSEDYDGKTVQPPTSTVDKNITIMDVKLTEAMDDGKTTTVDESTYDPDQSTADGLSMHIVWISVGVAFGLLIAIIAIMLIAIVCLTHKKNKIRVSSSPHMNIHNPYIEYGGTPGDSLKRDTPVGSMTRHDGSKSTVNGAAEVQYETLTNVIHSQNTTFGGEGSPESSTSLRTSVQIPLSPPGVYEDVNNLMSARGLRNQYETIDNQGLPEYSHLQHAHGGSLQRNFSARSTRTLPPPVPPSNNRGKLSATLSWSGHKTKPLVDEPNYTPTRVDESKSPKNIVAASSVVQATGYSHINHEALQSTEVLEPQGPDSDGYHQLPSVFTIEAKKLNEPQPKEHVGSDRQNSHTTTAAHHSVERHNSASANDVSSGAYTLIDPSKVEERNLYAVSILSTDDRYVSEQGHVYQVLERSDEHREKTSSLSSSNGGAPTFQILEKGVTKDKHTSGTIPPYGQVTRSPKQAQRKQKEMEQNDQCNSSQDSSEGAMDDGTRMIPPYSQVDKSKKIKNRPSQIEQQSSDASEGATNEISHKIPPYSQVDKSKKIKNRQAEIEEQNSDDTHVYHVLEQSDGQESQNTNHYHVLEQDSNDAHHYHVLEQDTNGFIEQPCGMDGGPIYHIIDHEP